MAIALALFVADTFAAPRVFRMGALSVEAMKDPALRGEVDTVAPRLLKASAAPAGAHLLVIGGDGITFEVCETQCLGGGGLRVAKRPECHKKRAG